MAILSDHIETFIKTMIQEYEGILELQRNELAEHFHCAPSQINYVLNTRFTPERGYVIESRRGGGGYIKVVRLEDSKSRLLSVLSEKFEQEELSERETRELIGNLYEAGVLEESQARLMMSALLDKTLAVPGIIKNKLRGKILKAMLAEALQQ